MRKYTLGFIALAITFAASFLFATPKCALAQTAAAPTNFATGALALAPHGAVTTLIGYSGQLVGVPDVSFGKATLAFDGFIGGGATTVNGESSAGAALYPAVNIGSLSIGVGVYEQVAPVYTTRGFFSLSFAIK